MHSESSGTPHLNPLPFLVQGARRIWRKTYKQSLANAARLFRANFVDRGSSACGSNFGDILIFLRRVSANADRADHFVFEGKVIGAIGVSGNTPQEDEDIAKAGAASAAAIAN